jgi:uncharacterized protein
VKEGGVPEPAAGRLEFVDALRGFALFGVYWANLQIFSGIVYMTPEQRAGRFGGFADRAAYFLEQFFIENKFMGLFSILFGMSFWLFLSRVQGRGVPPLRLFYRRILWLFLIGCAHGWLLWSFDILRFYALWAVCLPLFIRTPPRRLLGLALGLSVLVPALVSGIDAWLAIPASATDYDGMALEAFSSGSYREVVTANWRYDWHLTLDVSQIAYQVAVLGRLLLGLFLARTLGLGTLGADAPLLRRALAVGSVAGLIGSSIFAGNLLVLARNDPRPGLAFLRRLIVEGGQLGLTLAYASALALAFLIPGWRSALRCLAPMGQMALTWYLLQTVFGIWMFYGFTRGPALMGKVGPAALAGICLVGYGLQVAAARAWMNRFRFGPAEWLWRSLTYGKIQPFLRA